jgi:hypothetical protein
MHEQSLSKVLHKWTSLKKLTLHKDDKDVQVRKDQFQGKPRPQEVYQSHGCDKPTLKLNVVKVQALSKRVQEE